MIIHVLATQKESNLTAVGVNVRTEPTIVKKKNLCLCSKHLVIRKQGRKNLPETISTAFTAPNKGFNFLLTLSFPLVLCFFDVSRAGLWHDVMCVRQPMSGARDDLY